MHDYILDDPRLGHHARELLGKRTAKKHNLKLCDCGRPATRIGIFTQLYPTGNEMENAFLICEECAHLVDSGVSLYPFHQLCHACGDHPALYVGTHLRFHRTANPLHNAVLVCAHCAREIDGALMLSPLHEKEVTR